MLSGPGYTKVWAQCVGWLVFPPTGYFVLLSFWLRRNFIGAISYSGARLIAVEFFSRAFVLMPSVPHWNDPLGLMVPLEGLQPVCYVLRLGSVFIQSGAPGFVKPIREIIISRP